MNIADYLNKTAIARYAIRKKLMEASSAASLSKRIGQGLEAHAPDGLQFIEQHILGAYLPSMCIAYKWRMQSEERIGLRVMKPRIEDFISFLNMKAIANTLIKKHEAYAGYNPDALRMKLPKLIRKDATILRIIENYCFHSLPTIAHFYRAKAEAMKPLHSIFSLQEVKALADALQWGVAGMMFQFSVDNFLHTQLIEAEYWYFCISDVLGEAKSLIDKTENLNSMQQYIIQSVIADWHESKQDLDVLYGYFS